MKAIGLSEQRNCIAPANTFFSIVSAVENSRGTLKLADIETSTFNLDPDSEDRHCTHAMFPRQQDVRHNCMSCSESGSRLKVDVSMSAV